MSFDSKALNALFKLHGFAILLAVLAGCGGGSSSVPSMKNDEVSVQVGRTISIDVLANDSGVGEIVSVSAPEYGVVSIDGQSINFEADEDFLGIVQFSYETVDGSATVFVTVVPESLSTSAIADTFYVSAEDIARSQPIKLAVIANDVVAEGDALTLIEVLSPKWGEIESFTADSGVVVYKPKSNKFGTDEFEYVVESSGGRVSRATVTLGLGIKDGSALPTNDDIVLRAGESRSIDLFENDINVNGALLRLISQPAVVDLELLEDGRVVVTAPDNYLGSDRFVYSVESATDERQSEAIVSLTVYSDLSDTAVSNVSVPQLLTPRLGLLPKELAVIVNSDDPESMQLATDYLTQRNIPPENLFTVSLGSSDDIPGEIFNTEFAELENKIPEGIQGSALMFTRPFRVGCMSITSAFTFGGFDLKYCNTSGQTCGSTQQSTYFNSNSTSPYQDLTIRPSMMVAGQTLAEQQALIERGRQADQAFHTGEAYFYRTTDSARSVRWGNFSATAQDWNDAGAIRSQYIDATSGAVSNTLSGVDDVLFYLTGLTSVSDLDTVVFKPGAVADHLTSYGGVLTSTSGQMSILNWLSAGATASYGTVVEPCNYTAKFPTASVLLDHYYRGNSVVEAYWKSVRWPGEGVFVGEPLARPWGRQSLSYDNETLVLKTTELKPGQTYTLSAADYFDGQYESVKQVTTDNWGVVEIRLNSANRAFYRLQ